MSILRLYIHLTPVLIGLSGMYVSAYEPWVPPLPIPDDRRNIPEPSEAFKNVWQNAYNRQVTQSVSRAFDFSRWLREWTGNPKQALNVNEFDEVDNSSWFEHRNSYKKLTASEIRKGPRTITGPDTSDVWTIFKVKSEGMAPGFWIKDAAGNRFIIKPEIKGYPEVGTSAENITTLLFHAAGYYTPENFVTEFNIQNLKIKEGVTFVDDRGVKRPMNQQDLNKILERTHVHPNGKLRATASRFIEGKPVGSFSFTGTRKEDPNDIIPHQHRRELRGLYVLVSWTNHHDLNSGNFFESYIENNGKKYIRHYFLDFSSTLGASLFGAQPPVRGYTPLINPIYTFVLNPLKNWFHVPRWEKNNPLGHPSVGRFNNDIFIPNKFKINYPLAAFSHMTNRDAYWGAKLVMSFTDAQIRAVTREGFYSDTSAYEALASILIERRNQIGHFWYSRVNPLEDFKYEADKSRLCFTDRAVIDGLESEERSFYRYSLQNNGISMMGNEELQSSDACIQIWEPQRKKKPVDQIAARIRTIRGEKKPGPEIKVYLESREGGSYKLIGFERE